MKKFLSGIAALGVALAVVPMFAAFEAHVINVTATVENALTVPLAVSGIHFGTVFPQEQLDHELSISLSNSFKSEDRVDDVEYIIRQKPKCGKPAVPATNPVTYSDFAQASEDGVEGEGIFECPAGYVILPLLCPYLSKHSEVVRETPEGKVYEDGFLNSFHGPISEWRMNNTEDFEVKGRLAKSNNDTQDKWNIDLKVPCFGGHCAQDWVDFVHAINPQANPENYIQPKEQEHQLFGCDLWVEVTGISLPGLGCKEKADIMLVLDRSGSISSSELATLKTAAKAFVDAIAPAPDKGHIGQTSFSTTGSLDLHLSDSAAIIKAAIEALVGGGFTNLKEGIDLAKVELDNPGDGHDRSDPESPDFMVIITDGAPNEPGTETEAKAAAKVSADAAKAAGVVIYVVGVGTTASTATYLKDNIASGADHYFDAVDFAGLEAILKKLLECKK